MYEGALGDGRKRTLMDETTKTLAPFSEFFYRRKFVSGWAVVLCCGGFGLVQRACVLVLVFVRSTSISLMNMRTFLK
jgi:hypothetical protein